MAKKHEADPLGRIFEILDDAPPGLHDVDPPTDDLPPGLPAPLIELYAHCDGARIFGESLEVLPSNDTELENGRWHFATFEDDRIFVDAKGKVWRTDASIEDEVVEGTRIDRWLAGMLDALDLVIDHEGEYRDDVYDEEGDILPIIREKQLRAQLKRDGAAPAPRWRLAQVLLEQGSIEEARNELEEVVTNDPAFSWAWIDLSRVSERLGDANNALDEARMAAEAAEGVQHPQAGYFWSHVARLASATGNDMVRAEAATKASLLAPDLKRAQIDGVRQCIEGGDTESAKGLVDLLRAVWPRDLEVLELARRVDGN